MPTHCRKPCSNCFHLLVFHSSKRTRTGLMSPPDCSTMAIKTWVNRDFSAPVTGALAALTCCLKPRQRFFTPILNNQGLAHERTNLNVMALPPEMVGAIQCGSPSSLLGCSQCFLKALLTETVLYPVHWFLCTMSDLDHF